MLMKMHKRPASQECGLSSRAAENLIVLFLNTLGLCRTPPRAAPRPGTAPSTYGRTTQPRAAHPHLSAPAPRAALRYWARFVPPPPKRAAQKGPTPTNDTTPLPPARPPRTRGEDPVGSRATHALNEDHHPPTAPHFFPGKGWGVAWGGGAWPGAEGRGQVGCPAPPPARRCSCYPVRDRCARGARPAAAGAWGGRGARRPPGRRGAPCPLRPCQRGSGLPRGPRRGRLRGGAGPRGPVVGKGGGARRAARVFSGCPSRARRCPHGAGRWQRGRVVAELSTGSGEGASRTG